MKRDKREAIMQAAEKLFTSRRVHEITLDDIVREARVGKGTIYTYFKDKDDLFFQIARSGFDEMCELVRRQAPGAAGFRAQLVQVCESVSVFFEKRRQLFRMIQSEEARMPWLRGAARSQWLEKHRQLVGALAEVMQCGQAEGAIRQDLPATVLASLLLGLLRTRGRELRESGEAVAVPLLVDFFLRGAERS